MEKQDLINLSETTYGLAVILKDLLWKFEGFDRRQNKKFNGILSLIDTIEQNIYNIKVSIEEI